MKYNGVGFHPNFKNGRSSGTIEVNMRQVTFCSHNGNEFSFPMHGLNVEWGGTANRQVFFNHAEQSEYGMACANKKILIDDNLKRNPFVAMQSDAIRKKRFMGKILATLLILLVLALPVAGYLFKSQIVEGLVNPIPSEKIVEYTRPLADAYLESATLVNDEVINKVLTEMTEGLRQEVEAQGFDFRFYVVQEDSFNAMAFPDGTVVIHTGLFDKTSTDGQVLGVLAHELSHVTQRHQVRSLAERAGIMIIAAAVMGDINSLFDVVVGGGAQLYLLKNSRDFEREADEVGFALMEKAKIDPEGMVQTFELMGNEAQDNPLSDADLEFFSTHPSSENRVAYLKAKLAAVKESYPKTGDQYLAQIKERLKEIKTKK